ncbi:ATPase family AAA domain-containing protein 2 [Nothobranchius furzeri]|uniref:ATPase family AAA domain-containing protein 2-like n=3 Tax=Nothobranchius furzeri TaxID=105023 RepID=A0A9D2XYR1_NOTFU|nr:ATPase family AAA domain-containing protein 2-like [Nothobranchius furzeri]
MVTNRGKGKTDAVRRKKEPLKKRSRSKTGSKTRVRPEKRHKSAVSRTKTSGGVSAKKGKRKDKGAKRAKSIIRKSAKIQETSGGKRSRPRKSSRSPKLISKYQASNNLSKSMQKKINEKKRKRLVSSNRKTKPQRRRPPGPERTLRDSEDDSEDDDDSGLGTAADEDSTGSMNQNFNTKPNPASSRHTAANSRTFHTRTSAPNKSRERAFRPTTKPDEDESDSEDENTSRSCRPLSVCTGELVSARRSKMAAGAALADTDPLAIDQSVDFDSIGGLSGHISALKEMIVFPLLYPEFFDSFKIQPPRGCLFYGPPGTGKTLVARALANECCHGNRKVSFFMRKGADCLSKWVGESERQLRLMFEQAYDKRPSIIFFDEIDGLAPVRSSRQEHIHSSIVSTLLSLMDGLDCRGEVVVIGATNRLDSIDPALRRPGRFDRELRFGLPDRESRKEILKIHTRQWKPPPSEDFLEELAEKCVGYCGADIRAVCTEAALCALRRRYPQIFGTSQKLLLDVSSISVSRWDFVAAVRKMKPASQRSTACPARPLSPIVQPLLGAALHSILQVLQRLFPHAERGVKRKREPDLTAGVLDDGLMSGGEDRFSVGGGKNKTFLHFVRSAVKHPTSHRPRMLLAGRPESAQTSHLAPAVLHALEHLAIHSLDSAVLFGVSSTSPEEACAQVFSEAKRTSPSILYIPHIQQWWETAGPALRTSFLSLLGGIPPFSPILLLATCNTRHKQLDPEIQFLFREEYGQVYPMTPPTRQERTDFFYDLLLNQSVEPPPLKTETLIQATEMLPLPPPPPLSPQPKLLPPRKLRLLLRSITQRLILDQRFKVFTRPVDTEEVPDYLTVIEKPMDLSTLLSNIDEHKYATVSEFVSDADLIWQNALEYNPDSYPADRQIRLRARALRDAMRAMVGDEQEDELERVCEEIRGSRVKSVLSYGTETNGVSSSASSRSSTEPREQMRGRGSFCDGNSPKKKRYKQARKSKWSTGVIKKPRKTKPPITASDSFSVSRKSSCDSSAEETRAAGTRALNSSADLSSSSISDSSDGEQSHRKAKRHLNVVTRTQKVLMNGHSDPKQSLGHRAQSSRTTPAPQRMLKQTYRNKLERHRKHETRVGKAAVQKQLLNGQREDDTPPVVVDHNKLNDLLNRAVAKTEGAEVESLEKLYALLAQCIYRHRDHHNKTGLIKEMRREIDSFS